MWQRVASRELGKIVGLSLHARVLLLLVVAALLPALGLVLYNAAEQREEAARRASAEARQLAQIVAGEQDTLIVAGRKLAVSLGHLPGVRERDTAGCEAVVREAMTGSERFSNVLVATPDGKVFCSALPLSAPVNLGDRGYFQEALARRETVVSDYLVARVVKRPIVTVAQPVVDATGVVRVVVVVGVELARITQLLAQAPPPAGATITVVDRTGMTLARHPDPERWVGTVAPEAVHARVAQGRREARSEAPGADGAPWLFAVAQLGEIGEPRAGFVIVGIPSAVAFAEADRRRTRSLTVLGLLGLGMGLAGWAVAEVAVRRPVAALVRATVRLGAGDRSARAGPPYARGELGQLARAFDETAAALEAQEGALREARETLQAVIDNAPLSIVTLDRTGTVTAWNPAAERVFGWAAHEVLGGPHRIVPEAGRAEFRATFERALRGEVIAGLEVTRVRRDGSSVEVQSFVGPLRDAHGAVRGVIGMHLDVTERKALEAQQRLLVAALEAAATAVMLTDRDGRIEWVNPAFTRLTGFGLAEALGQTPRLLRSGKHDESTYAALWQIILSGEVWHGELINRRKDGSLYTEEQTITPVRNSQGEIAHFIAVGQDITERKRIQARLVHSEKLATMGELLASVAHELNNPLSVVMGQAALLRVGAKGASVAERADRLEKASQRCARIVKNFLALARQQPPERQAVSLNQVVHEAVELLSYALRVESIEVRLDLAADLPTLWVDPHQLHQVVVNLLTNARDALRASAGPRRVTLTSRAAPAEARVSLEVADTGPGIPPEIQSQIFEPFFTTKPPGEGTGLGLALCRELIEANGGAIRVVGGPGPGATVRIELPVEAPARTAAAARAARAVPPIRGQRVLVVDDEPEIATLLGETLDAEGHQVEIAANGVLALDRLRERRPDLILCDIKMPVLDGPGLYQELARRDPDLLRRFVVITGDVLAPATREFLAQTDVPVLSKPFTRADVQRVTQEVLRGR